MSKKILKSEAKSLKFKKQNEKKIEKKSSKEKTEKALSFQNQKKNKTQEKNFTKNQLRKKNLSTKAKDKKHKLKNMQSVHDVSSDEENKSDDEDNKENTIEDDTENVETENEASENEEESDLEDYDVSTSSNLGATSESELDAANLDPYINEKIVSSSCGKKKIPMTDDESELDENDPYFDMKIKQSTSSKRKKPMSERQNTDKSKKIKKQVFSPTYEGWEKNNLMPTKNVDFLQWQMAHPTRKTFFVGPDDYIYQNSTSMKKFVDAIKKNQITEESVSIAISPMSKVVATNPRITIAITGSRYISNNGEGYRVQPVFTIAKEYVRCLIFCLLYYLTTMLYFFASDECEWTIISNRETNQASNTDDKR